MQFLQKCECSCGSPKKMQIKGCTWGAAAGEESSVEGDGSLQKTAGYSQLHYANQWFRRNIVGNSAPLPHRLSITPGLFHLGIIQAACTTHLTLQEETGKVFLVLHTNGICLLFRELLALYYGRCPPSSFFPDAGFWTRRLFTHRVWQILTLKPTVLLRLLVFWSQETSVPKWQMDFKPISYAIIKTK